MTVKLRLESSAARTVPPRFVRLPAEMVVLPLLARTPPLLLSTAPFTVMRVASVPVWTIWPPLLLKEPASIVICFALVTPPS
ncbi:hypothetical protein D3C87_1928330 [compost metagenome]